MDTIDKLKILSGNSQYDLACACGTNQLDRRHRGEDGKWLYPVALPQGGYSILLKTLLSNACVNDCKYCPLRSKSPVRRCTLDPEEVAKVFMEYLRRERIHGLFLSSGVINSPDQTMEKINAVAEILRHKYRFRGFLHLKIIPGASDAAVEEALTLASTVSLNIETPGEKHFRHLSSTKDFMADIIRPLKLMAKLTAKGEKYSGRKCTTQFIVGAADETDQDIVKYMQAIYERLKFKRIYFSAYQKGLGESTIPGENRKHEQAEEFFMREHRLYQVDFLMRRYGFTLDDILFDESRHLSLEKDPKQLWAERHPEFFPVNINHAAKEELLRVPGLGPTSVNRILKMRKMHQLRDRFDLNIKGRRLEKIRPYVVY